MAVTRTLAGSDYLRFATALGGVIAVLRRRDVVRELVRKEFVTRYNGSLFGVLWTQLYPLLLLGIYSFVFTAIFRSEIPRFPLFLFVGITLWHFCSTSIQLGTNSILANGYLISRVAFPRESVTVAAVLVAGVDLLMAHAIILVGAAVYGAYPSWSWLVLPILVAVLAVICLGLGLALATAAVYLRDVRWFVEVGMLALMFLSPVFYSETMVPESTRWILQVNPFAIVLIAYRHALIDGIWPDLSAWTTLLTWAIGAIWLGLSVFRRWESGFADAV